MLARGARLAWNARNLVTSFLTTRALVETIALFDDLQHGISELLAREALDEIDELIMKRTFSTRDERILKRAPGAYGQGHHGVHRQVRDALWSAGPGELRQPVRTLSSEPSRPPRLVFDDE